MSLLTYFHEKAAAVDAALPAAGQLHPTAEMLRYARLLTGEEEDILDPLPLQETLRRKQLDYSVGSLIALDEYLVQVAPLLQPDDQFDALKHATLRAGAYLGEVLRRHAHGAHLNWAGYADLQSLFGQEEMRRLAGEHVRSNGIFLGAGKVLQMPFRVVLALIMETPDHASLHDFARQFLGEVKGQKLDNWLDLLAARR